MAARLASPPKILVARLSALGDIVRAVPAVAAIARACPNSIIDWLVEDRHAAIIEGLPDVRRLQIVPRGSWARLPLLQRAAAVSEFIAGLRAERYDVYVDFHGLFKSGLYGLLAGIPRRIGFPHGLARELNNLMSTERVAAPVGPISRYTRNLLMARHFDAHARLEPTDLPLTPSDRAFAESTMRALGLRPRAFAVLHPGTSTAGRLKQWLPERYADLAARLPAERALQPVLAWGPGEAPLVAEIAGRCAPAPVVLPATSPRQEAAIIASAAMFVGGDTGFLHVASLVGTPSVAIFGPSDPVVNAPVEFTEFRLVRGGVDCSTCRRGQCATRACMKAITVPMVLDAIAEMPIRPPCTSARGSTSDANGPSRPRTR
jgi:ADP-heptose:LPS heptosyltransferase